ncbi:MAG: DUF1800 family protein [Deltaproteobacteria bacterium]|nr:DUF1800 family protein [Deltaproteobacteria bacterium]
MKPIADEEKRIVHFLKRTSFGVTGADMEEVRRMGISDYLEQQLHPESMADQQSDEKLAKLKTLNLTNQELLELYPRAKDQKRTPQMNMNQMRGPRIVVDELQQAKMLRAVYSRRQLYEMMVDFWSNHFNVYARKGPNRWLVTSYDRDTIRPNALGQFRELLVATAQSPAMLYYLDNWVSVSPDSWKRRRNKRRKRTLKKGLNENYARELLELHTLGVNGGYTQKDVEEVARCFTGWTIRRPRKIGTFRFNSRQNDNGVKWVLGTPIPAGGGMEDGMRVIDLLAEHPSTANFICSKLVRRFIADDPPPRLVKEAAAVFRQTGGDIRSVLRVILNSPEFYSSEYQQAKIKKPVEFVASSLRALNAESDGRRFLQRHLRRMGEPLFLARPPTGYPDFAEQWISPATLLARLNFAMDLTTNRIRGTRVKARQSDAMRLAAPEFQRR